MPLDYFMKNIWNQTLDNQDIIKKFKNLINEYYIQQDIDYVGKYLSELDCPHYYHEFIKRALVATIEKSNEEMFDSVVKLIVELNHRFNLKHIQVRLESV